MKRKLKDYPLVVQDMFRAINGDDWMYICVWGDARTGKSTCCQGLLYNIYESWETVLQANIFNLNMLLYNMLNTCEASENVPL